MAMLSQKSCRACVLGVKLPQELIEKYKAQISPFWAIRDNKLFRHWEFPGFREVRNFVAQVSELAEKEGHHPDITFSYDYADIILYTHKVGGLAEEDFIMAAKIDEIK